MDCTSEIKQYIENNFSEKRKVHTEGVRVTAIKLAEKYGADPQKAEIAALFHDMYRGVAQNTLNYYVCDLMIKKLSIFSNYFSEHFYIIPYSLSQKVILCFGRKN